MCKNGAQHFGFLFDIFMLNPYANLGTSSRLWNAALRFWVLLGLQQMTPAYSESNGEVQELSIFFTSIPYSIPPIFQLGL